MPDIALCTMSLVARPISLTADMTAIRIASSVSISIDDRIPACAWPSMRGGFGGSGSGSGSDDAAAPALICSSSAPAGSGASSSAPLSSSLVSSWPTSLVSSVLSCVFSSRSCRISLSVGLSLTSTTILICLARSAYRSVESDSSKLIEAGETAATITVFELPPSADWSSSVSTCERSVPRRGGARTRELQSRLMHRAQQCTVG